MNRGAATSTRPGEAARPAPEGARRSHALEHLTGALLRGEAMQVLDLGGIGQETLDFVTGLGHRLYAEDLLRSVEEAFPGQDWDAGNPDERAVEHFLERAIPFANGTVAAVLAWDQFHYLPPALAEAVVRRLHRVMRPDGLMLALFHPESAGPQAALSTCRIIDAQYLLVRPRGATRPTRKFTPRTIERFLHEFSSVKFFMTRDSVQEVIARR
jgi:SAM-dependent methyltransferase